MKIALCSIEGNKEIRGTGTYAENLVDGIMKTDYDNEYIIFTNNPEKFIKYESERVKVYNIDLGIVDSVNFQQRKGPSPEIIWYNTRLVDLLIQYKVEVVHFLGYFGPIVNIKKKYHGKVIVTAHGLEHEVVPNCFRNSVVDFLKKALPLSFRLADEIIAVSQHVKEEVQKFYNIDSKKITVIHHGIGNEFSYADAEKKFILHVGANEPRKNVEAVIESYLLYRKTNSLSKLKLLIIGSGYEEMARNVRCDNVIFLEHTACKTQLIKYYQAAKMFISLSLYEGFGLVVAEALKCGVPVIASPAFTEVIGDGGVVVKSTDYMRIAEVMRQIEMENEIWSELKRKAILQGQKYTILEMAKKTVKLYERVKHS